MKLLNGKEITVRKYQGKDTEGILNIIRRNFKEVNVKDYGIKYMEELAKHHDANWFKDVAKNANVYVFCIENQIVGVGSISSFFKSLKESILLTIFVIPELHGNEIGRFIIQTLEQDELFLRSDKIEIPSSITAVEFYRKLGYNYKMV